MDKYCLGKLAPKFDYRTLQLFSYLDTAALPTPPAKVDYYKKVSKWPMFLNNILGCCTIAAISGGVLEWTTVAGKPFVVSDAQVRAAYNQVNGGSDSGAAILDVLNLVRKQGIAGHKIQAFVEINHKSKDQVKHSLHLFEVVDIGLMLPNYVVNNRDPLAVAWTRTAFASPNPRNGHSVSLVGYDDKYVYCVTWGSIKAMGWSFFFKYCDEAYALLSPDEFNAQGKGPNGFDMATLQKDLAIVTH